MAKVTLREPGTPIPGVYSVENVVEYMVCDVCDSYSIEEKRRIISLFWKSVIIIVRVFVVTAVVGFAISTKDLLITVLIGLASFIIFILTMPPTYLKCRKCGNENISDTPADPAPAQDVSEELTIKKYLHSYIS